MRKINNIRDNQQTATGAESTQQPSAAPAAAKQYPDNYDGVPYAIIVNALLSQFGFKDGYVPEGARNATIYKLARLLRYICDFDAAFIRSAIPTLWGIEESEGKAAIESALNSMRMTGMPNELMQALRTIRKPDLSSTKKRYEYLDQLNPFPSNAPWLFRYIYKRYGRNGRAAVIASLPMLGTLLGRIESKYLDGRKHRPVFMVVVAGHAAAGKGFITDLQEWLLKPIADQDAIGREQLRVYNKNKDRQKGVKELGEKPEPCIRILQATASNSYLQDRAISALGQPLITITEEIDQSSRANKAGSWSDKSDIYRIAFDGALWGQDYQTCSGSVNLYMNLIFAGTYSSVREYFNNVENGLMTRFFFTEMALDCGKNIEIRSDIKSPEDKRAEALVQKLYEMGSTIDIPAAENVVSVPLPRTKADCFNFNAEKIAEWEASGPDEDSRDVAIDILRRRAAVILFRAGIVDWALEGSRETQAGRDMARWFGSEMYLNQYIMFGDALNKIDAANNSISLTQDIAASRVAKTDALTMMLSDLPDRFTLADIKAWLSEKGRDTDQASAYGSRFERRGLAHREEKVYVKNSIKIRDDEKIFD